MTACKSGKFLSFHCLWCLVTANEVVQGNETGQAPSLCDNVWWACWPCTDDALAKPHLSGVAGHSVEAGVHLLWRRNSGKFWAGGGTAGIALVTGWGKHLQTEGRRTWVELLSAHCFTHFSIKPMMETVQLCHKFLIQKTISSQQQ